MNPSAKSIAKTNPKKTKKALPQKKRWGFWVLSPLLFLIVISAGASIVYIYWHTHIERGQFSISDTYVGGNPAHSLDLKIAALATYPSGPLTIASDLGKIDNLSEKVFKFQVKEDKLTEYGLMVTPNTPPPPKGYPVIILIHGYINPRRVRTQVDYLAEMEFYANHGFMVVKPDLRGQGKSIDSGFADSAYYSMAYNTDVLSLVTALGQTSQVDKSNINLWGHSMGAYISLRAAVLSKKIHDIILLAGPVDTLEEMYLTYIPPSDENNPYALATRNEVFAKYGTPADNAAFWYDASPINFLSNLTGSVQIFVGSEDKTVPPIFSADLNQALNNTRVKHEYFLYPGGNHSLVQQRPDIYAHTLDLLQPKTPQ